MSNSPLLKKIVFALSIVFLASCDKDFTELGADIIDDDIHHNMIRYEADVVAYDRATGAVQANNMPVNTFGVYNNPVFGKTVTSFVTQLELASVNPGFTDPVIDTVYLYVPYYSNLVSTDSETGNSMYTLDSIIGNESQKFRLNIYRNGYYLRSTDPGSSLSETQKYFSDEKPMVDAAKAELLAADENFNFKADEIIRKVGEKVVERFSPGIYKELDKVVFQNLILDAPPGKLLNNNVFKEYFRGLYFDVQEIPGQGAMGTARFSEGYIKIIYNDFKIDLETNLPTTEREQKTLTLNLKGNTINFFENTYSAAFASAINNFDPLIDGVYRGDEHLYIKGGAGSIVYIDIDDAAVEALTEEQMGQKVLINEANLVFYVDNTETGMGQGNPQAEEPHRLYLYNVKGKRPVYDYFTDLSSSTTNVKYNKDVHGGIVEYDANGRAYKYKIRITDHINNIVNKDSANITLGLSVTESINLIGNAAVRKPVIGPQGDIISNIIPVPSVVNPLGIKLYGSNPAASDKRLKLEIFYTKPN